MKAWEILKDIQDEQELLKSWIEAFREHREAVEGAANNEQAI